MGSQHGLIRENIGNTLDKLVLFTLIFMVYRGATALNNIE
jgi:hypothetical protein